MSYQANILYYARIYRKHWLFMVFLVITAMLFTGVKARTEPVTYRSVVTVLLLQSEGQLTTFGRVLGVEVSSPSLDIIFSILSSRRMRQGVNEHFNLSERPGVWWSLRPYREGGGFAVAVIGNDPELTRGIANFSVGHLDSIYQQLYIGSNRQAQTIKILDPAVKGAPQGNAASKKVLFAGLFSFLIYSLIVFSVDYLKGLK